MDENSCENETSESADGQKAKETENAPRLETVGVEIKFGGERNSNQVSDLCGSCTGTSDDVDDGETEPTTVDIKIIQPASPTQENPPPKTSETIQGNEQPSQETVGAIAEAPLTHPSDEDREAVQVRVRLSTVVEEQLATRRPSLGPPPSYSFVMKQKKKLKPAPVTDPLVVNTPPPPTYAGSRGMYLSPEERICNLPSFAEPMWRSHSQPGLCPRCGIIVLSTTHTHDSIATHVAAVALCLFGCWPCCLLPYCMNVCKNTYHYCPICQTYLGMYKPW